MLLNTIAAIALTSLATQTPDAQRPDDFDFWLGEWTVTNTRLNRSTNQWGMVGTSHARIRPVAGGKAILEEWNGLEGQIESTFGMSLRYFNESKQRWVIILNWPGGNNPNPRFSIMEGGFFGENEQARGEFFPPQLFNEPGPEPSSKTSVRFTFSEPREDSCKWDMATPQPDGTFKTTWVMQFKRTASPQDAQDSVAVEPIPEQCACSHAQARAIDQFHGDWSGEGKRLVHDEWVHTTASFFSTSAVRGCLTFNELTESIKDSDSIEHFEAWAYDTAKGEWGGFAMHDSSQRPEAFTASVEEPNSEMERWTTAPSGSATGQDAPTRKRYTLNENIELAITIEQRSPDGDWKPIAEYTLQRVPSE